MCARVTRGYGGALGTRPPLLQRLSERHVVGSAFFFPRRSEFFPTRYPVTYFIPPLSDHEEVIHQVHAEHFEEDDEALPPAAYRATPRGWRRGKTVSACAGAPPLRGRAPAAPRRATRPFLHPPKTRVQPKTDSACRTWAISTIRSDSISFPVPRVWCIVCGTRDFPCDLCTTPPSFKRMKIA